MTRRVVVTGEVWPRSPRGAYTLSDMADYGVNLGIAFQIIDDVLDITGNPEILGKPTGSDIREGNVTLPAILVFNNGSAVNREELARILRLKRKSEEHVRKAMGIIRKSGAVEKALADGNDLAGEARDAAAVHQGPPRPRRDVRGGAGPGGDGTR